MKIISTISILLLGLLTSTTLFAIRVETEKIIISNDFIVVSNATFNSVTIGGITKNSWPAGLPKYTYSSATTQYVMGDEAWFANYSAETQQVFIPTNVQIGQTFSLSGLYQNGWKIIPDGTNAITVGNITSTNYISVTGDYPSATFVKATNVYYAINHWGNYSLLEPPPPSTFNAIYFADNSHYATVTAGGTALDNPITAKALSIAVWFKPRWTSDTYYRIVDRWNLSSGGWALFGVGVGGTNNGFQCRSCQDAGWIFSYLWPNCADVANNWHWVVYTADNSARDIYWDGTNTIHHTGTWNTWTAGDATMRLGTSADSGYVNADYRYVSIYSRVLSSDEILGLIAGVIPTNTGLCAEYPFTNGTGSIISDSSGNGLDLDITGTPAWWVGTNN